MHVYSIVISNLYYFLLFMISVHSYIKPIELLSTDVEYIGIFYCLSDY